jgi:hypothetical protein
MQSTPQIVPLPDFDFIIGNVEDNVLDGRPMQVRCIWRTNPGSNPAWETTWTMEFQHR